MCSLCSCNYVFLLWKPFLFKFVIVFLVLNKFQMKLFLLMALAKQNVRKINTIREIEKMHFDNFVSIGFVYVYLRKLLQNLVLVFFWNSNTAELQLWTYFNWRVSFIIKNELEFQTYKNEGGILYSGATNIEQTQL